MKLTTKTFSLNILSFYIFLIYKSFSVHDKLTQIQLESAQGRCQKLSVEFFGISLSAWIHAKYPSFNRNLWLRMESHMSWMPATPVPSLTSSATTTSCAFPSMTATVRSCFLGWTKPMSSLVRISDSVVCWMGILEGKLGVSTSKVWGLVNTSHLCISIWGRYEWCQHLRWANEITSCFVCSLTVELLLTSLLFFSIHRQSQGVKLQSHRPLLGWHIPLCNHCHCLYHENHGPIFRWCLQVTAALWMFRYSMDCRKDKHSSRPKVVSGLAGGTGIVY